MGHSFAEEFPALGASALSYQPLRRKVGGFSAQEAALCGHVCATWRQTVWPGLGYPWVSLQSGQLPVNEPGQQTGLYRDSGEQMGADRCAALHTP